MATPVGPAGTASQVFTIPQSDNQRTAAEPQETAESSTPEVESDTEAPRTERVNPDPNVGSNVDTTA
ncbi:MAG: hypothetical protein OQL06_04120 [Gammaproteobacteria bacterium]|nr:hypothetical protein [Gammaproteobacteria bacterium]